MDELKRISTGIPESLLAQLDAMTSPGVSRALLIRQACQALVANTAAASATTAELEELHRLTARQPNLEDSDDLSKYKASLREAYDRLPDELQALADRKGFPQEAYRETDDGELERIVKNPAKRERSEGGEA